MDETTKAQPHVFESREAALEDALMYAISVVCNAKEHTTDDPAVWQEVMKRCLDTAHAALHWGGYEFPPEVE